MKGSRRIAWLLILIVDLSFIAWGAMAALAPDYLFGPNGAPIVPAEYEGFTGGSWPQPSNASPRIAAFITLLFRTYGAYNVAFGLLGVAVTVTAFRRGESWAWWALLASNTITFVSAIVYGYTVRAIGPFEMSEYVGLVLTYIALALTIPLLERVRSGRSTGPNVPRSFS